ncbi:MAG TPA: hypothetical protein VN821_04715 [Candidatus Udaeobacter sp.]|nr:hypothetical protein [Candidatus Udaeobacter sp.]
MRKEFLGLALLLGLASPGTALAGPAAMVEDVAGNVAGVGLLDYLAAGRVIHLATTDRLVLDYFHSCVRETIAAGLVTVGIDQSEVTGGNVTRDKVACDGGQLQLSAAEAEASAVVVFRGTSSGSDKKLPAPQRTLYGSSPLVELPGGGMLVIERLDKPEERLVYELKPADMIHGRFYDFARQGDSLDPGGLYRASAGGRSVIFALSPAAAPGAVPPVSRLLKL